MQHTVYGGIHHWANWVGVVRGGGEMAGEGQWGGITSYGTRLQFA